MRRARPKSAGKRPQEKLKDYPLAGPASNYRAYDPFIPSVSKGTDRQRQKIPATGRLTNTSTNN